jgi:transcriptional antiterminator RfaH
MGVIRATASCAWWRDKAAPYWACARLQPRREQLALHCLALAGYTTYFPQLRERRVSHGRRIEIRPPLFPGYAFVQIELQWHVARWSAGIVGLIMDGAQPAKVSDAVITAIRARERDGMIELPRPRGLRAGDRVRVVSGPFTSHFGLFQGMKPRARCEVLLALLGGQQRVVLPKGDIEAV